MPPYRICVTCGGPTRHIWIFQYVCYRCLPVGSGPVC